MIAAYFEEADAWARRAARNDSRAEMSRNRHCRRTLLALAEQANALAGRAALLAAEESEMEQTKSGLHPYRAALFFILRESEKAGPRSRAAVVTGDIDEVSQRQTVRMLAVMFDKTNRAVARDLIDTYRALEDGQPAP
jgi:hypothetical protein